MPMTSCSQEFAAPLQRPAHVQSVFAPQREGASALGGQVHTAFVRQNPFQGSLLIEVDACWMVLAHKILPVVPGKLHLGT